MHVKFSLGRVSILYPVLFFLTSSIPASAQQLPNFDVDGACDNIDSSRYSTRLDVRGKLSNQFTIVGLRTTTTFFPDLRTRVLITNFYIPRVSQSFSGYQTVKAGPRQESVAWVGRLRAERLVSNGRTMRLDRAIFDINANPLCLPSPNQPIGQNPPPNPSPDPTPPPESCTRNESNGYYCPPVAFASPSRLIASSVVYIEPQTTDAVGSQSSLELGTWEGTQWG
jgi:hypothetical protein